MLALSTLLFSSVPALPHALLGFLVGLVLPGYYLVTLTFPRNGDLAGIERWGLILVLNVMLVIFFSLFISLVHPLFSVIRLDAPTVTGSLSVVTVLLATGLVWRRMYLPPDETYQFTLPRSPAPWLLIGFAVVLAVFTWFTVSTNLSRQYPALSITSPSGQLTGYPFQVAIGSRYALTVHVDNPTSSAEKYHLVVSAGGTRTRDQAIAVGSHGRWSRTLALPSNPPARSEMVHFMLEQKGHIVRTLWIRYQITP